MSNALRKYALAALVAILLIPLPCRSAITTAKGESTRKSEAAPVSVRQFEATAALIDGTPVSITVVGAPSDEGSARSAISQAISRILSLDRDTFSEGGIEERINALPADRPLKLSADAFDVVARAVELAALTHGWYDAAGPSPSNLFTQRDWRRIELNRDAHTIAMKSDGMRLDLKAISRGSMVDLAMGLLQNAGITNAMVEVGPVSRNTGRDIYTPWTVEVGFGQGKEEFAHRAMSYNLSNIAAATVTPEGLGRDLVDPRSKHAITARLMRSVTVFAAEASTATAYALAAYTLGAKIGFRFVQEHPEVGGILVDNGGNFFATRGLDAASVRRLSDDQAPYVTTDGGPNDLRQKENEENKDL